MKKIVADFSPYQTRIAYVEDGVLTELLVEKKLNETIVGNIYIGRVENVLAGMQAAFVNIGQSKNAFLTLSENNLKKSEERIVQGMDIIVQVAKEATGTKGAKVTNKITVTGRYSVLVANQSGYIGISQKIEDSDERSRLRKIVTEVLPKGYGIIIRTNADGVAQDIITEEIKQLEQKMNRLFETAQYRKSPALLYKDSSPEYRAIRDMLSEDIDEFVVNDEKQFDEIKLMAEEIGLRDKVRLLNSNMPIFEHFSLETQIQKALQKHIWLKSGGFLIIEPTEACVVIDVNTGKFTGKKNLEETIFKTNKEAAVEIAKQIRLRNLSGMIIVDFIDMVLLENRKELLSILSQEVKKDRVKTNIIGMTELGLVQITRKKMREPLYKIMLVDCVCCNGSGKINSLEFQLQRLVDEIESTSKQTIYNSIKVYANEGFINAFSGKNGSLKELLEKKFHVKIELIKESMSEPFAYKLEKHTQI